MIDTFQQLHPLLQAFLATCFTWFLTALGAGVVFLKTQISRKVFDVMLGFAAGVMIAASFWSLLAPALEISQGNHIPNWLPATAGFLLGGVFIWGLDKIL